MHRAVASLGSFAVGSHGLHGETWRVANRGDMYCTLTCCPGGHMDACSSSYAAALYPGLLGVVRLPLIYLLGIHLRRAPGPLPLFFAGSRLLYVRDRYLRSHELQTGRDNPLVSLRRPGQSQGASIGQGPRSLQYNTLNPAESNVLVGGTIRDKRTIDGWVEGVFCSLS